MTQKISLLAIAIILLVVLSSIISINPRYTINPPLFSVVNVTTATESTSLVAITNDTQVKDLAADDQPGTFVLRDDSGNQSYIANNSIVSSDINLSVLNQASSYSVTVESIPYDTQRVYDYDNLTWGEAKTTPGKTGESITLWEHTAENEKKAVLENRVSEPVPETTVVGRKKVYLDIDYSQTVALDVEATAYTDTITATGIKPYKGVIAVDPKVIPLYTKVYIPGYGMATALDTGGAVKGNIIDLFFEDGQDVWVFGRRNITIYIFK